MSLKLRYFNYALRTWLQVANLDGECREATFFYDGIKPSSNFPENGASKRLVKHRIPVILNDDSNFRVDIHDNLPIFTFILKIIIHFLNCRCPN